MFFNVFHPNNKTDSSDKYTVLQKCLKLKKLITSGFKNILIPELKKTTDVFSAFLQAEHGFFLTRQAELNRHQEQLFHQIVERSNEYLSKVLTVQKTHQIVFPAFKNKYMGRNVAVVATGPTLRSYRPMKNVVHIGINKAFLSHIPLDYLFMQDYYAVKPYIDFLKDEQYHRIQKFFGLIPEVIDGHVYTQAIIPESIAILQKAYRYYVDSRSDYTHAGFCYDLSGNLLADMGSTVFSAVQFALWTNPRRLFLIGCDCSEGYFDHTKTPIDNTHLIESWKKLANFAKTYYPLTRVICINPVGLKGIFRDIYTSEIK